MPYIGFQTNDLIFQLSAAGTCQDNSVERKKDKADEDYEKRTNNPLGKITAETTYVNVTLKKYTNTNSRSYQPFLFTVFP